MQTTTKKIYCTDSEYTPERLALHKVIIEQALENKTPTGEKFFLLLGGGTGNGKGPMRKLISGEGEEKDIIPIDPNTTVVISSGLFKHLPEYMDNRRIQHPEKLPVLWDEAKDIIREIIKASEERGLSILLVDHGDDKQFTLDTTSYLSVEGYDTALVGMGGDLKLYFVGAAGRAVTLGWDPDHSRGLEQTRVFSENWEDYTRIFNNSYVFGLENEAQTMLASFQGGKNGFSQSIIHPEGYALFKEKRCLNTNADNLSDAVENCPLHQKRHFPEREVKQELKTIPTIPLAFEERLRAVVSVPRPLIKHLSQREMTSVKLGENSLSAAAHLAFYVKNNKIHYSLVKTSNRYGDFDVLELPKGTPDSFWQKGSHKIRVSIGGEKDVIQALDDMGEYVNNFGTFGLSMKTLGYEMSKIETTAQAGKRKLKEEHGCNLKRLKGDKVLRMQEIPFRTQGKRGDYILYLSATMLEEDAIPKIKLSINSSEETVIPSRLGVTFTEHGTWGTLEDFKKCMSDTIALQDNMPEGQLTSMRGQLEILETAECILTHHLKRLGVLVQSSTSKDYNVESSLMIEKPKIEVIKPELFSAILLEGYRKSVTSINFFR